VTDILREIAAGKRREVVALKARMPLEVLRTKVAREPKGVFRAAISDDSRINIIAELKKASPSKGVMVEDFDPVLLAERYAAGGAAALSVVTEQQYFLGRHEYLISAKQAADLPVLCKDFMIDEYQLYYARHMGADAVLLIVRLLSTRDLAFLLEVAKELGLDCLVEVHNADEVRSAADCGAEIVGVNNRDLRDFSVRLETSEELAANIPEGMVKVSESGILAHSDIVRLKKCGFSCFLIGEALVTAVDPVAFLKSMRGL